MPRFLECQRCAACCRWPGQVRISEAEIHRIAAHLRLKEPDFIERCTRLRADRRGLSLTEREDGACVFLAGNECLIQPVKPQQCRDFPNLWSFEGFERWCQAIGREVNEDEYRRLVMASTGRHPAPGQSASLTTG